MPGFGGCRSVSNPFPAGQWRGDQSRAGCYAYKLTHEALENKGAFAASLSAMRRRIGNVPGPGRNRPKKWRIWLWAVLAGLAGVAAIALAVHFLPRMIYSRVGYLALEKEAGRLGEKDLALVRGVLGGQKARVVWSSSRSGNHEIYLMELPAGKLYQLTDHPHVDYFPRFSPDGKQIVFARSREKWVSERKPEPWDVYLLDLAGGKERRLAEWGNNPQWVDQNRISFLRGGKEVFVLDLATGKERRGV